MPKGFLRKPYEPGEFRHHVNRADIHWPDHPLANAAGSVPLRKLQIWQDLGYDERALETIRSLGGHQMMPGEYGTPHPRSGYVRMVCRLHPLADKNGKVLRSWAVFWQESGYADWVLDAKEGGAEVDHRDGVRDNDDPSNLRLRWRGQKIADVNNGKTHKSGWTLEDIPTDALMFEIERRGVSCPGALD